MIGRPNAQNKARKGVLRQSSGGARRKPAQTQNSFSRARPNAQAAQKPPNNSAARGGAKPPNAPNKSVGNRGARPRWRRAELANALFSPTTSRRRFPSRTRCGAAPTPARPRRSLSQPPTRAPHRPMPPKLELRIGGAAPIWRRGGAGEATQAAPESVVPTIPFVPIPDTIPDPIHRRRPVRRKSKPRLGGRPAQQETDERGSRRNAAHRPIQKRDGRGQSGRRTPADVNPAPRRRKTKREKRKDEKTKDGRTKRPETGSVKKRHERGAKKTRQKAGARARTKRSVRPRSFGGMPLRHCLTPPAQSTVPDAAR